jgi:hypothetical protein
MMDSAWQGGGSFGGAVLKRRSNVTFDLSSNVSRTTNLSNATRGFRPDQFVMEFLALTKTPPRELEHSSQSTAV